jgi:uncharacterized protein (TIGR00251 family)
VDWFSLGSEGLRLEVRIIPRASRDQVVGVSQGRLKLKLTAAPVDGKANAALVRFLADLFGVAKSHLSIVRGEKAREKTVVISPAPAMPVELQGLVNP